MQKNYDQRIYNVLKYTLLHGKLDGVLKILTKKLCSDDEEDLEVTQL